MQIQIQRLDDRARGIAEHDGLIYVCDGALPGETVAVEEIERRRRFAIARRFSIVTPAAARARPACGYYGECGGCQLQQADYPEQLHYKQSLLEATLQRHGEIQPADWLPPLASVATQYRRRARLRVRVLPQGELVIGFNRRHRSYLLDIADCSVLEPRLNALLDPLHALVAQLSVRQRLPQIELVCGDKERAVVFRHLQPFSAGDQDLLETFAAAHDTRVFTQAGGPDTALALNRSDAETLHYELPAHGLKLAFAPTGFIQAHTGLNRLLVDEAVHQLQPQASDRVLDLFCGIGNFSLPLARYAGRVVGVEMHPGLIRQARENARHNALANAEFIQGDLCGWAPPHDFNKALLDPPREGAIEVIKRLAATAVEKLVYVSCNPQTLARDARYLCGPGGFRFVSGRLVDMFPQTRHIEVLAVFER